MKCTHFHPAKPRTGAFKLIELMIAIACGALVLTVVMTLYLFGMRSFAAIGNYSEMDAKSRQALDNMLREIRQASLVLGFQTNGPVHWLKVASCLTNVSPQVMLTNLFTWDSSQGTFTWDQTGQPTRTLLTGCDAWNFACYLRTPNTNGDMVPTSSTATAKLINMSWTCSRTNIIRKMNTESVVTAEVVLRNLQE